MTRFRNPAATTPPALVKTKRWLTILAFLAPAILAMVLLRIYPLFVASESAFVDNSGGFTWQHFEYLFTDPIFQHSLVLTLIFSLIINPVQILLALLLAVLLSQHVPLVGLWRSFLILPIAIPQTVSAVIWGVLLRPDGPINGILARLGMNPVPWLTSPKTASLSMIILLSWVGVGYWMVFLIAGINDISPSLYEAASLDGAGAFRKFWSITIPGLRRQLLFVLVADTVSNFLIFAPINILTKGGPEESTNLLMFHLFETSYIVGDLPTASAGILVLVTVTLVIVGIQFRLIPGKD